MTEIDKATLDMVFQLRPSVKFDRKGEDGHVRVITDQNRRPQRLMRRLGLKIPERSYRELDAFGSFVFLGIDGKRSVRQLGEDLVLQFPEAAEQLYERLLIYLNHLESNEKWIERRQI